MNKIDSIVTSINESVESHGRSVEMMSEGMSVLAGEMAMLKEQSETGLLASENMVTNLRLVNNASERIAESGRSIALDADGVRRLAGRLVKWLENFRV